MTEETGLNITLSETPKTGFLAMRPIYRPEIQEGKERLESFSVDFRYKRANKGLKASQLTFTAHFKDHSMRF